MDAHTCAGWRHALEQPQAGPALGHQPWSNSSRLTPKVHLHYTPTYSSWLNQVENWFARIERDVIARGVFTSVKDLARKLMRYIRHYNRAPTPIKWTYHDPSRRISPDTNVTVTDHCSGINRAKPANHRTCKRKGAGHLAGSPRCSKISNRRVDQPGTWS